MGRITEKTVIVSAASAGSTSGWINLNTHQENFHIGFTIANDGPGDVPVMHVDGTLFDVLTTAALTSSQYFPLISAVSTGDVGVNVAGEITFPVAAVRIRAVSGGSANTTLHFRVIQTGKI